MNVIADLKLQDSVLREDFDTRSRTRSNSLNNSTVCIWDNNDQST